MKPIDRIGLELWSVLGKLEEFKKSLNEREREQFEALCKNSSDFLKGLSNG
jgi:hypothetical protein